MKNSHVPQKNFVKKKKTHNFMYFMWFQYYPTNIFIHFNLWIAKMKIIFEQSEIEVMSKSKNLKSEAFKMKLELYEKKFGCTIVKMGKEWFITQCDRHRAAYSVEDINAGKISRTDLSRKIVAQEPVCACCYNELNGKRSALHLGARLYQFIAVHQVKFPKNIILPKRSDITDRRKYTEIICPRCSNPAKKSYRDVMSKRAEGCNGKGCSADIGAEKNIKETLSTALPKITALGFNIEYILVGSVTHLPPFKGIPNDKKLSGSTEIKLTCSVTEHNWSVKTNIQNARSGVNGCTLCAKQDSRNEKVVQSVLAYFLSPEQYERSFTPDFFNNKSMHLDFYIKEIDLAIEVQGTQHYEFTPAFHATEEDFHTQEQNDTFKKQECMDNGLHLIQFDARELEKINRIDKAIIYTARQLMPQLEKINSTLFPVLSDCIILSRQLEIIKHVFRDEKIAKYNKGYKRLIEFCNNKGITILDTFPYINSTTCMAFQCEHQESPVLATPSAKMQAKGGRCCTGEKASQTRALKAAAKFGLFVSMDSTQKEHSWPPRKVGKDKFSVFCIGQCTKTAPLSINTLLRKNTNKPINCKCIDLSVEEIMSVYSKDKADNYVIDRNMLSELQAKNAPIKAKQAANEAALEKLISDNPGIGRDSMLKLAQHAGISTTAHTVRKKIKELNSCFGKLIDDSLNSYI
ncbi:hypothetical protein GCM10007916_00840 [Psychromonas marina]|uniref:DUF559 domain-containing protein n=1 Tax=Psychromonas marina TaxID=88364 RepID=A0ABQ6DV93_9GAMM|nr:hypothetical protein [Psychromonas marina]GLS89017.1 hypothetical protein GCM10007916_00840 [Psychromonas marina]